MTEIAMENSKRKKRQQSEGENETSCIKSSRASKNDCGEGTKIRTQTLSSSFSVDVAVVVGGV